MAKIKVQKNTVMDFGMSNDKYQEHDSLSKGKLTYFAEHSPLHYKKKYIDKTLEKKSTEALDLGNAIHCAVLEPTRFKRDYLIYPAIKRTNKAGKLEYSMYETRAEVENRILLKEKDAQICKRIRQEFEKHPIIGELLKSNHYVETSFFWKDKDTGLEMKCRTDLLAVNHGIILDIKTARELDDESFEWAMKKYKYHWQPPIYNAGVQAVTGIKINAFIYAAWEKEEPFGVKLFYIGDLSMQIGTRQVKEHMAHFAECKRKNQWLGYTNKIRPIELPRSELIKQGFKMYV